MKATVISSADIKDNILIPKYYNNKIESSMSQLGDNLRLLNLGQLIDDGVISVCSGDEPGKMAYGTGDIPFVRTSDISNWEIKTIPKQGVSETIYQQYAAKEDVQPGDILLVKDGTYLIGTSCIVTPLDTPMLFQSHIVKFRVEDPSVVTTEMFFIALNTPLVQQQIRAFQFTADIIDTIGTRYREIMLPIPIDVDTRKRIEVIVGDALKKRMHARTIVKQFPVLIEKALQEGSMRAFREFDNLPFDAQMNQLVSDTSTLEFGQGSKYAMRSDAIVDNIFIPKYYDPMINEDLDTLAETCDLVTIAELVEDGALSLASGDEPGKMAYGTGTIPFVRTSDFANWEIKHDPKQGVSEQIYNAYATKEDVQAEDILLVRDGTYLIGNTCIITPEKSKMLYCGGLIKIRALDQKRVSSFLLLALLNSYIVKRQIRSKQFTRDVIDTLGNRFPEIVLPIPKNKTLRDEIAEYVRNIIIDRIMGKDDIEAFAFGISWLAHDEVPIYDTFGLHIMGAEE